MTDFIEAPSQVPAEKIRHTLNWTADCGLLGAFVDFSAWSVSPAGPTLSDGAVSTDGKKTTIVMMGGTLGTLYSVKNQVIFTDSVPTTLEQTIHVLVETQ